MSKEQLPQALADRVESLLGAQPTVLFMKGEKRLPQCGFSSRVVDVLTRMGVEFRTVNVLSDPELREAIKIYSDWPTIPQLYHQGKLIGGCDIVVDMAASGELAKVLQG